ncbi:hypothetical protein M758_8G155500 [Ceratodon purpureus]|uniref:Uncharacterized protein n=1 Tax=Ceratodon purpureus TaxID=3225 RepID=A0A8T0H3Y9_CERPU|nr:hypothetical protein KC19_8G159100 [Ceratodon purpureus]KAG0609075.1 hypothetical protein M758_8G155500 [Ceratodon purpureus]
MRCLMRRCRRCDSHIPVPSSFNHSPMIVAVSVASSTPAHAALSPSESCKHHDKQRTPSPRPPLDNTHPISTSLRKPPSLPSMKIHLHQPQITTQPKHDNKLNMQRH